MVGNPNHDKAGLFSSGHNSGAGNRSVAKHVKNQNKEHTSNSGFSKAVDVAKYVGAAGAVVAGVALRHTIAGKVVMAGKAVAGKVIAAGSRRAERLAQEGLKRAKSGSHDYKPKPQYDPKKHKRGFI